MHIGPRVDRTRKAIENIQVSGTRIMKRAISGILTVAIAIGLSYTASAQSFGGAIVVAGDQIFIGETANEASAGTVYIYERNSLGEWAETAQLMASDNDGNDDRFGRAMGSDGRTLVVGSTTKDSPVGAAYVFERDANGSWVEKARLAMDDLTKGGSFGRAIAVDGDFAFISAAGFDEARGAVFVFKRGSDGNWSQHTRLLPPDGEPNTLFGLTLDMQGNRALIGAQYRSDNTGVVFAYSYNTSTDIWEDQGEVVINGMQNGAQLGAAVMIDGDRALVSAPGLGTGSVMMLDFDSEEGAWRHNRTLNPMDGEEGLFGGSVNYYRDDVWVGAPLSDGGGRIYRYHFDDSGSISMADKLTPEGLPAQAEFGTTFKFIGDVLVAGAVGVDYGLGAALILEQDNSTWVETTRFITDLGMEAITGSEVRCESGAAEGFDCDGVDMLSFLPLDQMGANRGVTIHDVWGWTDQASGREFAMIGRIDGTSFVEVTDPMNPVYLGNLERTEGTATAVWRDIKVYRNYAYVVADGVGNHGIQIFDLTQLLNIDDAPVEFEETAHYDGIASTHNIVINESTGFAYTVGNNSGGETCGGGSHILDLRNPLEPSFAGCFGHEGTGNTGTGYTHDAQCVTYSGPDTEYVNQEICFAANENALSIANLTDKTNPVPLSRADYPNIGYTHQGWITDDHRYFYTNDETDELDGNVQMTRTLVWDVTDLDDPVLLKEFMGTTSATDHNLYIRGSYMYQSHNAAGLRILDISDPANPVEVAYFDTEPDGENVPGFVGSWSNYPFFESGNIIVSSRQEGLFMLKKREVDI